MTNGTVIEPSISRGHRNQLIYWISIIYKNTMGFFTSYDLLYDATFERKIVNCKVKQLLNRFDKNLQKKLRHLK